MKTQVFINPKSIPVNDRAFNYGDGLFETILVNNGEPLFLKEHLIRLNSGCKKLRIELPSQTLIEKSINKSIGNTKKCIIKIIYSRGISSHGYGYDKKVKPQLYIIKKKATHIRRSLFISLRYSKYKLCDNSYLSKIKHLNRLEQILGFTFADRKEGNNNILIDKNDNIIECISSNIFLYTIKKNSFNFVTPDLSNSGVDGIMKKVIIKFMKRKKINISENTIKQKDTRKFHGAFICNSVTGIQFVKKIGEHALSHSKELEAILDKFVYE